MPDFAWSNRSIAIQQRLLRGIDLLTLRFAGKPSSSAPHLVTGLRGEEEALFHLRTLGYVIVARRWKTPKVLGDVDLIAWDGETLCFIEVKTRTGRDIVPAEFAVDRTKQQMLRSMASVYRKRFPEPVRQELLIRFDVVSVYFPATGSASQSKAEVEVFPAAFER